MATLKMEKPATGKKKSKAYSQVAAHIHHSTDIHTSPFSIEGDNQFPIRLSSMFLHTNQFS